MFIKHPALYQETSVSENKERPTRFDSISSQTQSVRRTGSSYQEGQVHSLHRNVKAALKTYEKCTWKELQSEEPTQVSWLPGRTQAPQPQRGRRGWEWIMLGRGSQEEQDQEGPEADFYLKHNLKRGQSLIFIHPMSKCKETAVYFSY